MSKIVLLLVVIAAIAQALPANEDLAAAAARGEWDFIHKLINERFKQDDIWAPIASGSVKTLKPVQGGHVYGESEYTYHNTATNQNGEKMESSGGHRVINDDGKVQEYDFKPKF